MQQSGCTVVERGERIRTGALSPVALVHEYLERIREHDGGLRAFIEVTGERALIEAADVEREIAAGRYRGPLHGIPYALKDLCHVRGLRTTAGSRIVGGIASEDATIVARLSAAGAILIGKTNLHELAFGPLGTNPHYGDVRNPWDVRRHSGGSSGGSAVAVAAEMCAFAIGSDTTGSIRIPAAFCGVVGLKPTYGRVSRAGSIPLAWSLDHFGPICRTAQDAALILSIIAGSDPRDATTLPSPVPAFARELHCDAARMRVGVLTDYVEGSTSDVAATFDTALAELRRLGMRIEAVRVPQIGLSAAAAAAIVHAEALACHGAAVRARGSELAADVRQRFDLARLVSGADYVNAQRVRALLIDRVDALFARFDVLASPTEPLTAPHIAEDSVAICGTLEPKAAVVTRFTRLFNLTGHPALTIPCGLAADGMPVGLQLVAPHWEESAILQVAHAFQEVTDWHRRVPPLQRPNDRESGV